MADRYLLESSAVDGYLLEDGSGVLLLEVAASWARNAYEDELYADGAVFVVPLEEASGTVYDIVASKAGTVTGSPTYGATGPITGKTAIDFGNVAHYITYADHADLDLGDYPFTIEFWYARDDDTGGNQVIINKQTNAYAVNINSTDQLQYGKAGVAGIHKTSETVAANSVWHHYAIVRDGNDSATIYIDGVGVSTVGSDSPFATLADNALALEIGRESGQQSAGGKLAYVAFYKTALSGARVLAHYNASITAAWPAYVPDSFRFQPILAQ